ncbi:MAG: RibD family protein, partial [Calditrichaeota bacterium]
MLPLRTKIEKRGISQSELLNRISSYLVQGQEEAGKRKRPVVTVTYAQSLDGSISLVSSAPLKLSNGPSLKFTHHLRILHDAILIGIGTLIADNPRLTARLIQGKNPRPVVVDSHLRFPLEARLIRTNRMKPWIAATRRIDQLKEESLDALGGKVIKLPS